MQLPSYCKRETYGFHHCVKRPFLGWYTAFDLIPSLPSWEKKGIFTTRSAFFRYDGGDGDLVPLYLVTQKGSEDENFTVGTISYGLQSVIGKIKKYSFKILGFLRESLEKLPHMIREFCNSETTSRKS